MIDIHAHILPGLDDGAPDIEVSLEMARRAAESGVKAIIATPHYIPGVYENSRDVVLKTVESLNRRIQKEDVPLTVMPGTEVYIDIDLPLRVKNKQVLTMNDGGKYLLLEFPMAGIPDYANQVIFELQLSGITPIIAHPERNKAIINDPQLLYDLLKKGALAQVTASSLKGVWGRTIAGLSVALLELGWVHFVSTDAHSPSGSRSLPLAKVLPDLENIVGVEEAKNLVFGNPKRVQEGVPIVVKSYKEYTGKRENVWDKFCRIFKHF